MLRILRAIEAALLGQRGHLFPWVPVAMATGIGGYFILKSEPAAAVYMWVGLAALILAGLAARTGPERGPLVWLIALALAGFLLAGLRAHQVAGPVIGWRYYGPVEGRIVGIDRSGSDALRLTLDRVVLHDLAPQDTPLRVRISLHGDQAHFTPEPGLIVMTTAHIAPPGGPVEPGGFDFQRHAWFQSLGGVGYTRVPVLVLAPADGR
ncbi:MAG TPA: DUF4131 domain-containing protein, partial [Paracoccaceae bacterium]|nr:DUF4131 domain-containing protein [Paracoccaceae bacterium]